MVEPTRPDLRFRRRRDTRVRSRAGDGRRLSRDGAPIPYNGATFAITRRGPATPARYYQRIGLLKEPEKPAQGYRQYPREIAARIRFIKRMQRLGFRLREIAELLSLSEGQCPDVRARAEQKRRRIEARIQDLAAMRATLDDLIDACRTGPSAQACQILATLAGESPA